MLRKLIKHEFRATGRVMLPMYLILLASAVATNFVGRFDMIESRVRVVNILAVLLIMAFSVAVFGVCIVAFMLMVQRFYKNLLQDEGYLMLTLPVSIHQHIWAKMIVSAVWFIATIAAVILAGCIVAYDVHFLQDFIGFLKEIIDGFRKLKISEALNGTVILIEFAVFCFLSLVSVCVQFYAALAAGHSRPNHKMAWSIGFFFVFQSVIQTAGTLFVMWLDNIHFFTRLYLPAAKANINNNPFLEIHTGLLVLIAGVVIYGGIFYAVTTFFLKRHLNLE